MSTPTLDQLKRALVISEQIESLQKELGGILGNHSAPVAKAPTSGKGNRGKRSPETIAKMKAAQKKRWAKITKAPAASKAHAKASVKKKRQISPEHRAKLVASAKARWAAVKKK
jgi:hypothetical protein